MAISRAATLHSSKGLPSRCNLCKRHPLVPVLRERWLGRIEGKEDGGEIGPMLFHKTPLSSKGSHWCPTFSRQSSYNSMMLLHGTEFTSRAHSLPLNHVPLKWDPQNEGNVPDETWPEPNGMEVDFFVFLDTVFRMLLCSETVLALSTYSTYFPDNGFGF